jgi:hypothetical protein
MHSALLAVVPSVFEQRGPVAQRQEEEEEHKVPESKPAYALKLSCKPL